MGFSFTSFLAFLRNNPAIIAVLAQKIGAVMDAIEDLIGVFDSPRDVLSVTEQSAIGEIAELLDPHVPQARKLGDGKWMAAFGKFASSAIGQMLLQLALSQLGKLGS